MKAQRLLAVIPALRGGGAERALAGICSAIAAAGHEVTVLTIFPPAQDDYPLDRRCARETLNLAGASTSVVSGATSNWSRVRALRRRVREIRPHATLSFMESANVLTILAAAGLGPRVVVVEQVDPRMHEPPFPWKHLRRLMYPFADLVVVLTEGTARAWARPLFGADRVAVIPNPVLLQPSDGGGEAEPGRFLLAVGRLEEQKGFDTLLRAYATAVDQGLENDLVILGDGPERAALTALVASLGLEARVRLAGRTNDIARWYRGAHAFVLSSRFEGLPLALLEALAFGVPCVATNCVSGPAELLADGAGLLVPVDDVPLLSAALLTVARDDALRATLVARSREVVARHSMEVLTARWLAALGLDA